MRAQKFVSTLTHPEMRTAARQSGVLTTAHYTTAKEVKEENSVFPLNQPQ